MTVPSQPGATHDDSKDTPHRLKQNPGKLYRRSLFRIAITALLLGGTIGLLKGFEARGALTRNQKYQFNAIFILLTLLLGINMTNAHSQVVIFIREGIMNRNSSDYSYWGFRRLPKFKKITGLRSTFIFLLYIMNSDKKYRGGKLAASVFFLVWLVLNLILAISIALIGYTYSLEDNAIGYRYGNISITDIEYFFLNNTKDAEVPEIQSEVFVSKLYTDISTSYANTNPQNPGPNDEYQLEELAGGWRYNFRQSDPARKVVTRSSRYINATATCEAYRIESYDYQISSDIVFLTKNGSMGTIPWMLVGDGTTYISLVNEIYNYSSNFLDCGPRCGGLVVTQIQNITDLQNAWVYLCRSEVYEVVGARLLEEELSNDMAQIAATSLSYSGFTDQLRRSYGYYPDKVYFGVFAGGKHQEIERLVSRASAGCIAAMDQMNPRKDLPGLEPWLGVQIIVKWDRLIYILVVIFLLQLIIVLCAISWHNVNYNEAESHPQSPLLDPLSDPMLAHSGEKMHDP